MFPVWLKLIYTAFVCVVVPVYWRRYGAANFLWFSDIALFGTLAALWFESSLLASTMALAIILPELVWNVDFFSRLLLGADLNGLSSYMFDRKISTAVRSLSLFHVFLPPLLVWMVCRLGYDRRALLVQTLISTALLPISRYVSTPEENINWVFGFGRRRVSTPAYLALLIVGFPVLIYLPTHLILAFLFE